MENKPTLLGRTNEALNKLRKKDISALNEGHLRGAFEIADTDDVTFDTERRTKIASIRGYAEILLTGKDLKNFGSLSEWRTFMEEVSLAVEDGILDERIGYSLSALDQDIVNRLRE